MKVLCPACDAPLRISDEMPPGKRVRCPKCEEAFLLPAMKNGSTAAPIHRAARHDDEEDEPTPSRKLAPHRPKRKKKQDNTALFLVAGGLGFVILVAGIIGFILLRSNTAKPQEIARGPEAASPSKNAPPPSPEPTPTTVPPIRPEPQPSSPSVPPPPEPEPAEPLTVGLEVGNLAPEIDGEDIDGRPFKLSDYRGKVVLLDFWGHW